MAKSTGLKPILYITDSTGYGGAEKYLEEVAAHFSRLVQVELLLIGPGCPELEQHMKQLSIPIIRINDGRQSLLRLYKHLLDHRSWLLHANLTYYDSCRHVQILSIFLPLTKIMATIHTLADAKKYSGFGRVKEWGRRQVFNRFNLVLAPSSYIGGKLNRERAYPVARTEVIFNGVPSATSDKLNHPSKTFQLIVVGRLHLDKGHKYLFQALERLMRDEMAFHCLIVGDGPLRQELEQQVESTSLEQVVSFHGFSSDVQSLLSKSDVLVLPSLPESENFPLTILEAMSAGLPVIATKVGGVPEQVVDGKTGLLVDPGNSEQLAIALSKLISNPDLTQQMGISGQQRFNELFTQKRMVIKIEQAYLKLTTK